jgi:putative ABC transport system ATP-binding protein
MKNPQPCIVAEAIFKSYRKGRIEVPVLRGASLEVEKGQFLALMGPSGSGKSTFLNLIGALALSDKGSLRVNGVELSTMSDSQRTVWRAQNVGLVFQRYHLIDVLSAEQNVEIPLLLRSMTKGERRDRVRHALDLVGMGERAKHLPSELSGGQEQRIAIARALVADAPLLLCDEPTGNLDTEAGDDVLCILQSLSRDFGKTVIMVTHNVAAAAIADQMLCVEKGVLQTPPMNFVAAMGAR